MDNSSHSTTCMCWHAQGKLSWPQLSKCRAMFWKCPGTTGHWLLPLGNQKNLIFVYMLKFCAIRISWLGTFGLPVTSPKPQPWSVCFRKSWKPNNKKHTSLGLLECICVSALLLRSWPAGFLAGLRGEPLWRLFMTPEPAGGPELPPIESPELWPMLYHL